MHAYMFVCYGCVQHGHSSLDDTHVGEGINIQLAIILTHGGNEQGNCIRFRDLNVVRGGIYY